MSSIAVAGVSDFARRLIAQEQLMYASSDSVGRAAFRVCEKLRPPLSRLIGVIGFRALFSRALTLAQAQVQWLGGLEIGAEGIVRFSVETQDQLDSKEAARGGTELIAQLLGLLIIFIGEALTSRIAQSVWPKPSQTELDSKGNSHEKVT
jgi:hypothetical protein